MGNHHVLKKCNIYHTEPRRMYLSITKHGFDTPNEPVQINHICNTRCVGIWTYASAWPRLRSVQSWKTHLAIVGSRTERQGQHSEMSDRHSLGSTHVICTCFSIDHTHCFFTYLLSSYFRLFYSIYWLLFSYIVIY